MESHPIQRWHTIVFHAYDIFMNEPIRLCIIKHESNENVEFQRNRWFMISNVTALNVENENVSQFHRRYNILFCNGALFLIRVMLLIPRLMKAFVVFAHWIQIEYTIKQLCWWCNLLIENICFVCFSSHSFYFERVLLFAMQWANSKSRIAECKADRTATWSSVLNFCILFIGFMLPFIYFRHAIVEIKFISKIIYGLRAIHPNLMCT